jgi:hypothetical protein
MCLNLDQGLIVAALVLVSILCLLLCARLWIAAADYLLRRRMTLPQFVAARFDRFSDRLAERSLPPEYWHP